MYGQAVLSRVASALTPSEQARAHKAHKAHKALKGPKKKVRSTDLGYDRYDAIDIACCALLLGLNTFNSCTSTCTLFFRKFYLNLCRTELLPQYLLGAVMLRVLRSTFCYPPPALFPTLPRVGWLFQVEYRKLVSALHYI